MKHLVCPLVGILTVAVSVGCTRLSIDSNPPGASVEALRTESHSAQTTSIQPGRYVPDATSLTGMSYQGPQVQTGTTTSETTVRKVVGYTPLTMDWSYSDEPDDFITIRKGQDSVTVYAIEDVPAIFVDFVATPIRVRGARLVDSSRAAQQE